MSTPIGPIGAAAIAAGSTILSNSATAYAQGKMNRKTRKWNEKMYDVQRQHALQDWEMMNDYNSPAAQMERFRDAGLNPNLIYGQTNEAGAVRSSDAQGWSPRAPTFDIDGPSVLQAYYDVQLKEANLDNLRAQQTVLLEESALKAAQTASTAQGTAKSKFELDLASELKQTSLETAAANLNKMKTETSIALSANERAAAQSSMSLREAAERILKLRLEQNYQKEVTENTKTERVRLQKAIEGLDKDIKLKQLDIDLKEKGIQPSDNIFFRILGRLLEQDNYIPSMPGYPRWKIPKWHNPGEGRK